MIDCFRCFSRQEFEQQLFLSAGFLAFFIALISIPVMAQPGINGADSPRNTTAPQAPPGMAGLSFGVRPAPVASAAGPRAQQPQQPGAPPQVTIEDVETRGNRRIPRESILYYIQSKPGDTYNDAQARRDLEAIIGTGWFDPLQTRVFADEGPRGGRILIFQVREYPIIRALEYRDMKSVTESDVLTRFKERRVGISKEAQFDPAKVNGARIVLRDLLSEKGHPDAKVDVEVEDISATAVGVVFKVNEGPRVRVKEIVFETSNNKFSQRQLRKALKYTKEAGLLSSFQSKDIYFKDKFEADLSQVRFFLGNKGYLQTVIGEPRIERSGKASSGLPLPFLRRSGPGVKITVPIEIGRRYKISKIEEKGVTLFQPNVISAVAGMRVGEYATAKSVQDGIYKNVKDLYGTRGYIQASAEFLPKFIDKTAEEGDVEVTIEVEEGRQYTMKRLEFIGNSNTRDVVMRREVLLNEGDPYNKQLWDYSVLRLNQLGLFEEVKEKDAITRTNDRDQTLEIDLQVKERGRQQIQLNGGVSGIGGSFFGISYSTNNLLGYGESLDVSVSAGNRQKFIQIGINEPYLFGKPISAGIQLFLQQYQFIGQGFNFNTQNQALQASIFGLSSIDADTLFTQKSAGGTLSFSAPLGVLTNKFRKYSGLTRVGLSYSLSNTRIADPKVNSDADTKNDIPVTFTQPRIITSRITPSLFYNSLNSFLDPTRGQYLSIGLSIAGGFLGGDVRTFAPTLEYKFFTPVFRKGPEQKPHVIGMRLLASHIRSFGKAFTTDSFSFVGGVPIYERFFLGGEDTIRGYNIRSISPLVPVDGFFSTRNVVPKIIDGNGNLVDLPSDSNVVQRDSNNNIVLNPGSVARAFTYDAPEGPCADLARSGSLPTTNCNVVGSTPYFTPVGGDTQLLYNFEYRIPIFTEKFQVVPYFDIGTSFNIRKYSDQIVKTPFLPEQVLNAAGINVSPSGRIASDDEISNNPSQIFRQVQAVGESRRYEFIRLSQGTTKVFSDLRSSMGVEFRLQMPVINVPFRLIYAHNPNAKTSLNDPGVFIFGFERRDVFRFSVGRTF
ncbi:MAG: outer membrane protein assembly factor BamA [Blastocatellia bacterium]